MNERDLERFAGRRVLIVGDVILDRYIHGDVDRISPEAPVPVVRVRGGGHRPGGAANVAANVAALGAKPILVSIVGDDASGAAVRDEVRSRGISPDMMVTVPGRVTTVKTRVIAHHQQVVRLDEEDESPASATAAALILENAMTRLVDVEAVIVSDYAKGTLDGRVLTPLLKEARARRIPVVIDPKLRHFDLYQPATLVTPNLGEAARALGLELKSEGAIEQAARSILDRLQVDGVLITLGEEGMLLLARDAPPVRVRARRREVYDVTGAGDTVVAVLGLALAARLDLENAARWANSAAAIAVGRLGTVAVSLEELRASTDEDPGA